MQALPIELQLQICSRLDIANLKSLRQVRSDWAQVAAAYLFKEIWVTCSSIERLVDPSFHQILDRNTRTIVIYADRLPFISLELWRQRRHCSIPSIEPEENIDSDYERYLLQYWQQQRYDQKSLQRTKYDPDLDIWPSGLHTVKIIGPKWHYLNSPSTPPYSIGKWCKVWRDLSRLSLCSPAHTGSFDYSCNLLDTLRFLSLPASNNITTFQCGPMPLGIWMPDFISRPELQVVFTKLRTLDLQISDPVYPGESAKRHDEIKCLSDGLSRAKALKTLRLHVMTGFSKLTKLSRPSDFLRDFKPALSRLTRMEISGMATTPVSLINFLAQCRATLTSASVEETWLVSDGDDRLPEIWSAVTRNLVVGDWKLVDLHFQSLFYVRPGSVEAVKDQDLTSIQNAISSRGHR